MTPTITRTIRQRPVTTDDVPTWAALEIIPLLKEMTAAQNFKSVANVQPFPTANTGLQVTIWTSADIAVGTAVRIDADVMAQRSSGVPVALTITGLFYNNGTVTQEGATAAGYSQNTPGWLVNFLIVSNHVELQVEDTAAGVSWTAVVTAQECP